MELDQLLYVAVVLRDRRG